MLDRRKIWVCQVSVLTGCQHGRCHSAEMQSGEGHHVETRDGLVVVRHFDRVRNEEPRLRVHLHVSFSPMPWS
jgi:hypothetical protein